MNKTELSIVIPNWNGKELLRKNLPLVIRACENWQKADWEIIVVDDASGDDSVSFLKSNFPKVEVVAHQKNQRFAAACNTGVKSARGKIVILLNNDVSPEPDFLKPLLVHFENESVFAVGCREKDVKNGRVIYSGRSEGVFRRGFLAHWRADDQNQTDTFWAAGGSMAVSREKWLELGGMDSLYRPAYWEDIDLSWRARKKGWRILFEPKSLVNHHHEMTNIKAFGKKSMLKYAYKNQFLFVWKNGSLKMIILNILWLPYHLLKSIYDKDWLFIAGFFLAISQLLEVIGRRLK